MPASLGRSGAFRAPRRRSPRRGSRARAEPERVDYQQAANWGTSWVRVERRPEGLPRGGGLGGGRRWADSCARCGRHSSRRGKYQLASPSSVIVAGRRTPRISVASSSTAAARPTPACLSSSEESVPKGEKTHNI